MRRLAPGIAGLLLAACGTPTPAPPPKAGPDGKVSYNRRELESRPGVFTGRDGVWTIYRSDADRPPPEPPAPPKRTTLSCERGHECDPPDAER